MELQLLRVGGCGVGITMEEQDGQELAGRGHTVGETWGPRCQGPSWREELVEGLEC